MAERISIDPKSSALLVMDFQTMNGYAVDKETLLARAASPVEAARNARMMVLYVVVGFRAGHPEISPRNLTLGSVKAAGLFAAGDPGAAIHPAVAPRDGEMVVTKHRVGAFSGTDLDMILHANGIGTLLLAGIATSGVALSTLRHAADADYRILVVADCCSNQDEETNRLLIGKIFPRQALIIAALSVS
jgi:nicotinamidase-related amidase